VRLWKVSSSALAAAGALTVLGAAPVYAQAPATIQMERQGATARMRIVLPENLGENLGAEAEIAAGAVLVARLSEPISADVSGIAAAASDYIAMARLDPDGRTLRLALNTRLDPRISVSHNIIAIDLAPPGAAPLPDIVSPWEQARAAEAEARRRAEAAARAAANAPPPALPVTIRTGEAAEYTRIIFQWPQPVDFTLEQNGDNAVLRFSRLADIDLSQLRASPPRLIEAVETVEGEGLALSFTLADGVQGRVWSEEPGRIVADFSNGATGTGAVLSALTEYADMIDPPAPVPDEIIEADEEAPAEALAELADGASGQDAEDPAPTGPDPVTVDGPVTVQVRASGEELSLSFSWPQLPGAAVFRRNDALWIVFDVQAELDASEIAAVSVREIGNVQVLSGNGYAALRMVTPGSVQADVRAAGATWTVTLVDSLAEPPRPVRVARDTAENRPAVMRFGLNGARSVVTLDDPVVGDVLLVLTAEGEKRGVIAPRRYAESELLASVHGVALRPFRDDLQLVLRPGGAELSRPGGLALSRVSETALDRTQIRPMTPGFLDLEGWRGGRSYLEGRRTMERRAANMEPEALMGLARLYLGWGLGHEALTIAAQAEQESAQLGGTPEMAALRGAASYMMGRYREAEQYLSHPVLASDPAAQPWRALTAAHSGNWPLARRRFEAGRDQVFFLEPVWRARIHAMHALAALQTNDIAAVQPLLDLAEAEPFDPEASAWRTFAAAGLAAATGREDEAVRIHEDLARAQWTPIRARALLEQIRLKTRLGRITSEEAAEALESLRFRWRGDDVEVEAAAILGRVYAEAGRYDEALTTMAAARARFPDSPVARRLGMEMETRFRDLFLGGGADRMDALDALSLWYEHQDLTPPGPDGLRIARRIAERLVSMDLLEPAAELLAHQVFERNITMTGLSRAQIATDLAQVYLMDNRPDAALRAIESTRVSGLPAELVAERRMLQARGLASLGRAEHALELISNDRGEAVERLRADITWNARRWEDAGRRSEALLGDRWRDEIPLEEQESHDVLRALIAYALAGDEAAMDRIEARYGGAMARTGHAAAFSMVAARSAPAGDARLDRLVASLGDLARPDAFMSGFANRDGLDPPES